VKTTGLGQGGGQMRAAIERIGALPCLDLDMLAGDLEALGVGEAAMSSRCASIPSPLLPCPAVETRM
jgi:hypothetical protein